MKNSKEILSSVLKTTQMGQIGIRSVLDRAENQELRRSLHSQLQEYDTIETEAHELASQRGWELPELSPSIRKMSEMMTRAKLMYGNRDSKIAGMMVQGNTRGVITGLKNLHQYSREDTQVTTLSQKLLDCEQDNIRQMYSYL